MNAIEEWNNHFDELSKKLSTMTEQKPNCGFCPHAKQRVTLGGKIVECKSHFVNLNDDDVRFIKSIGCLSHPGARAHLMKDVIEELEKCITTWNENLQPSDDYESGIISGLDVAIKLLHGDTQ
jgi:hypothetical protein